MKRPKKYVVLEHLRLPDRGFRFWSRNTKDNTHGHTGELWYKEILFTDSETEAIQTCREQGDISSYSELEAYYAELYKNKNK